MEATEAELFLLQIFSASVIFKLLGPDPDGYRAQGQKREAHLCPLKSSPPRFPKHRYLLMSLLNLKKRSV